MNKFFRSVLLVGALLGLSAAPVLAQSRIATINLVEVFDNYWKTKQAKQALADSRKDTEKEIDGMKESHKKLIQGYQRSVADANDQAVSSEERDKRKKALETKVKELRESEDTLKQFISSREAELKVKTERMMEDVIKDIRAVVAGKAKSGGFAYVLDSSGRSMASTEVVFYSSGENDLTKAVIAELNITAPADAAK